MHVLSRLLGTGVSLFREMRSDFALGRCVCFRNLGVEQDARVLKLSAMWRVGDAGRCCDFARVLSTGN
jgi:hypothetical protein